MWTRGGTAHLPLPRVSIPAVGLAPSFGVGFPRFSLGRSTALPPPTENLAQLFALSKTETSPWLHQEDGGGGRDGPLKNLPSGCWRVPPSLPCPWRVIGGAVGQAGFWGKDTHTHTRCLPVLEGGDDATPGARLAHACPRSRQFPEMSRLRPGKAGLWGGGGGSLRAALPGPSGVPGSRGRHVRDTPPPYQLVLLSRWPICWPDWAVPPRGGRGSSGALARALHAPKQVRHQPQGRPAKGGSRSGGVPLPTGSPRGFRSSACKTAAREEGRLRLLCPDDLSASSRDPSVTASSEPHCHLSGASSLLRSAWQTAGGSVQT